MASWTVILVNLLYFPSLYLSSNQQTPVHVCVCASAQSTLREVQARRRMRSSTSKKSKKYTCALSRGANLNFKVEAASHSVMLLFHDARLSAPATVTQLAHELANRRHGRLGPTGGESV